MRTFLASVAVLLSVAAGRAAQSPTAQPRTASPSTMADMRRDLLSKARTIYGDESPKAITFATIPRPQGDGRNGWSLPIDPGARSSGRGGEGPEPQPTRYNKPGDIANGVPLIEEGDQVYVDASPCNGRVMVFVKPYKKTPLPTPVTCGGKSQQQYSFVQQ